MSYQFQPEDFDFLLPDIGSTSTRCKIADFVNNKLTIERNKIELELEKLESAHMRLDSLKIPRKDEISGMTYSLNGRINLALEQASMM